MKLNLSVKKIVEKEFSKKKMGGLSPDEVDDFLNLVIEDYETIAQYIDELKTSNRELRDENYKLKKDLLNRGDDATNKKMQIELERTIPVKTTTVDLRMEKIEEKMERLENILLHLENKITPSN